MTCKAWGKTHLETSEIHPLAHHSMDVAAVFLRLIQLPVIRTRLEELAGDPLTEVQVSRLASLVFLHDIGKLHPGFQAKGWTPDLWSGAKRGHLKEGWAFLQTARRREDHPFHKTICQIMDWGDQETISNLISAIISHHGTPVDPPNTPNLRDWDRPSLQHYDWRTEAHEMDNALQRWFCKAFGSGENILPEESRFHHEIAGLVALADWIGSDERFFPFKNPFTFDYDVTAHHSAAEALKKIGMDTHDLSARSAPSFSELTGHATPNPAQRVVGDASIDANLLILEAETGSGKTEAALWRFTQLFAAGRVSGLYFAVPTRSAAKQLHQRVTDALHRAFGKAAPEAVLAIPGMLRAGEFKGQRLPDWKVRWDDADSAPHRWAAEHATRFLAATVAVGTVDQAMLAGLQVKHAHLRGSALSRSLLVIDEVHASDTYMTEILKQLLEGHSAAGGYAMLMSATLGSRARARLAGTCAPDFESARTISYPAVWVEDEGEPRSTDENGRSKVVHLEALATMEPTEVAKQAISAARRFGRVLVIRNTVDSATATWRAVREMGAEALLLQAAGGPALHHGRFAVEDRTLLDRAVETALAPTPERGQHGCIVTGTQTLEQSLDIDADLLITDLCPMDVLLQRIGRLHRHTLPRPNDFRTAQVVVLLPDGGLDRLTAPNFFNGLGAWSDNNGFAGIYRDLAGLELTRRRIEQQSVWRIPEMNRELVEGATHPARIASLIQEKGEAWDRYDRKEGGARAAERMCASLHVLKRRDPFNDLCFPDSDERVMTRLGEEGVILPLDPPIEGPFGQPITRIALPAHWSAGISKAERPTLAQDGTRIVLTVAEREFTYSREGLKKSA